ncbi:MAG: gliding motility protein GldM [Flavobacteriaceae bacterium]
MAGGKLSPRQRMINLMYLVFIAMLAMNMSKEVLSAFGNINEKLVDDNTRAQSNSGRVLDALELKASEQPDKYRDEFEKAKTIKEKSDEFHNYLEGLKDHLLVEVEDAQDYESMDKTEPGDVLFFQGDGYSVEGEQFIEKINAYKNDMIEVLGPDAPAEVVDDINNRFDTSDQDVGEAGKQPWLNARYEGFPLIATITNITALQSDIVATEREIFNFMLSGQLEIDAGVNADTYGTIFMPDKPAFLQGERVTGKIVLGRYDASLKPDKVVVNGQDMNKMKDGAALVSVSGGRVGENKLTGEFVFQQGGESVSIPIDATYMVVAKPSDAVISADKMNVVYRGIENPITISIPGVADKDVRASATGLKKVKGINYVINPGKGKEVVINVSGTMSNGERVNSKKVFRIKDIPAPMASVRREVGVVKMPKASLSKATIGAELVDFVFDLKLQTTGFKIKVPGQATVVVNGNKLDGKAQRALTKAKRGDIITIFDVKAKIIGNSSYRLKNVMPVSVELSN